MGACFNCPPPAQGSALGTNHTYTTHDALNKCVCVCERGSERECVRETCSAKSRSFPTSSIISFTAPVSTDTTSGWSMEWIDTKIRLSDDIAAPSASLAHEGEKGYGRGSGREGRKGRADPQKLCLRVQVCVCVNENENRVLQLTLLYTLLNVIAYHI